MPVDGFFNTNFTLVNFVAEEQPGELQNKARWLTAPSRNNFGQKSFIIVEKQGKG